MENNENLIKFSLPKKCLIVVSEPFHVEILKDFLKRLNVKTVITDSIDEIPKLLENYKIDFAIVYNTILCKIAGVTKKINYHTAGSVYASKFLEEKEIPYLILETGHKVPKDLVLKNCFWKGISIDMTHEFLEKILKKNKLI